MTTRNIAFRLEGVSKQYRIGELQAAATLRESVMNAVSRPIGRLRSRLNGDGEGAKEESFWALNDVSLDVAKGEVLGIIGRNGAGKSTLLKLLSRITEPTSGRIELYGRVGSLLEVGTGFHPELTGRENIFLNGAILGMSRAEINQKFDEIVAFSEVERFLDMPVKRYSSGMYVRLAFAVAAHLEPDILIVDEVLAVGDAEFQKKCLGKMRDVSRTEGRTIIFVSHNVHAVNNLCNKAILLQKGRLLETGDVQYVIHKYANSTKANNLRQAWDSPQDAPGTSAVRIKHVELVPHLNDPNSVIDVRTPLTVRFEFWNHLDGAELITGIHLFTPSGDLIFDLISNTVVCDKGIVKGECHIPGNFLNDGTYYFSIIIMKGITDVLYYYEECITFDVEDYRESLEFFSKWMGFVRPKFPFKLEQPGKLALVDKRR